MSSETVRVTLDGTLCAASGAKTILELCSERGLTIPTLCHDPRIAPTGACGVCVVEVRRGPQWKLEPACATHLCEGMVVRTASASIDEARRWALTLLMSDHYADCVAPCTQACPAEVDVPGYVKAVGAGRFDLALERIRQTNPLPGVCGRVCPHRCELRCRRGLFDDAVAINHLKRLATDAGVAPPPPTPAPDSGKRVAIVGAGPAGLTAAWFLRLRGHAVELYDARAEPGGMLRYAIPEYRLSRAVLDRDVAAILDLGVAFHPRRRLGGDLSVNGLFDSGFSAVFVALGAWKASALGLAEADGVLGSLDFLCRVNDGRMRRFEGPVAVIGGGNSAVDAARAAVRLGASPVRILYRRDRAQMPAFAREIDAAVEEGVELLCLVAPSSLSVEQGRVSAVRLERMRLGEPDASGRPRPVPVPGSEHEVAAALVITAIGEAPEVPPGEEPATLNLVSADTLQTSRRSVFAGGDFVTGPATVVEAIAAGRRAATAIDHYLASGHAHHPPAPRISRREAFGPVTAEDIEPGVVTARAPLPTRPAALRVLDFDEGEVGYGVETGGGEAGRCLGCGCSAYDRCILRRLANDCNVDQGELVGRVHNYHPEQLRPGLHLDMNKCVRCERCVRICDEIAEVGAFDFVLRGFDIRLCHALLPDSDAAARCDACLSQGALCVDTCPTGALATTEMG